MMNILLAYPLDFVFPDAQDNLDFKRYKLISIVVVNNQGIGIINLLCLQLITRTILNSFALPRGSDHTQALPLQLLIMSDFS